MKWLRDYEVAIQNPSGEVFIIRPPFSAKINISRNTLASANKGKITFYNLAPNTRNSIFKDKYSFTDYWQIIIKAGYEKLTTIFQGNIYESISYKQGTEWITQIDAFDGMSAIQNGYTSQTVAAGTSRGNIIQSIIGDMPNIVAGTIGGDTEAESDRGQVLVGQSSDVLEEQVDGKYFIDGEVVNVLEDDEVLGGEVILLDEEQLFATPKIRDTFIDCEILFLPEVAPGLICEVRSKEARFNGQYKTMGFTHDITISSAQAGKARTTINLYKGAAGLQEVSNA